MLVQFLSSDLLPPKNFLKVVRYTSTNTVFFLGRKVLRIWLRGAVAAWLFGAMNKGLVDCTDYNLSMYMKLCCHHKSKFDFRQKLFSNR